MGWQRALLLYFLLFAALSGGLAAGSSWYARYQRSRRERYFRQQLRRGSFR
jgi:hypothetical protein